MRQQPPRNTRAIAAILFSLFVIMTGYGVLLPILPFFVERLALRSGIDQKTVNFHVGALTSVYPLFQLLFSVFWARLSDRFGRRGFIAIGLLGFILMQLLIGLSTTLTMFYIARILGGIFSSAVIPVSNAYLSDITPSAGRSKIMAWSGAAISTGLIAGPVVSGYLSKTDLHVSLKMGIFHLDKFSVPFFALIFPAIAALFLVLKALKPTENKKVVPIPSLSAQTEQSLGYSLMILLSLSFIYQFSVASFETAFSIYAKNGLSFSTSQIGTGFMLCGLFMAVFQPLFTAIKTTRISQKLKLLTGFTLAALALLFFPLLKDYRLIYLLIILFAIGGAMIGPLLTALVSLKDDQNTAKNLSVQASVNSVGQMLGPLIGTWWVGKQIFVSFMVSGGLLILPVLLFSLLHKRKSLTYVT